MYQIPSIWNIPGIKIMNNVTCFGRLLFISMINSQDLESEQFYLFWQFNVIVNKFKDKYSELIDLFWLCFIHLINSKNLHVGCE